MYGPRLWLTPLLLLASATTLPADVAVLLEEPYGLFGAFNPTGHAAVYLSDVCAASPLTLRRCEPGEPGVVISRYQSLGGYDWVAIPVVPFFYAVDRLEDVPAAPDQAAVQALREAWRHQRLQSVAPDRSDGTAQPGNWNELIGVAYDRATYGFQLETSPEDDDRLIRELNSAPNRRRFSLLFRNCADFARTMVNRYYPRAVRRSFLADAGVMTPKQVAKSLVQYGRRHSDLQISSFVVPQTPGNRRRSKAVRGLFESVVRSKKYAAPLAVFQPWIAGSMAVAYLTRGRFNPPRQATRLNQRQPVWVLTTAIDETGPARRAPAGF